MTRQRTIATILTACALAWPATAGAEPAPEVSVGIEVDVSALPEEDRTTQNTREWVRQRQTTVLEGEGFAVGDGAADVVRIEISRYGEYGVHTKARMMVVGEEESLREFTCEACTDSQFLGKVEQQTALLAEWLRSDRAQAAQPASESVPAAYPEAEPAEAVEDDHGESVASAEPVDRGGKRIGGVGYAGIASLALGAGVTVGGVVLLAKEPTVRVLPEDTHLEESTTHRGLGGTLAGIGGALLVSGIVGLVVDQTILRKRRSTTRAAAILHPSASTTSFGASLTGRF